MKISASIFSVLFSVLFFLPVDKAQAQTFVSGGIYNNATWSLANSPYIMTGPVVVFPGKTLTIEPGVEVRVKFNGIPNTGYMHYLEIRGSLVAVGTPAQPIVFRGDTLPQEYSWLGINVKASQGGQLNMNYFEFDNSFYGIQADQQGGPEWTLNNCIFRRNNYALQPFGPLNIRNCLFENNGQAIASGWQVNHNIKVKGCEFRGNYSCNGFQSYLTVDSCVVKNNMNGIWYAEGPITRTLFENNTFAIYAISGSVSGCTFKNNYRGLVEFLGKAENCSFSGNGIAAELASGCRVTGCSFQNDTVAASYASALNASSVLPVFKDNQICGSLRYFVENRSDISLSLDENCFCLTDSAQIENLIFDGYDDFTKGLINYTIYDVNCQDILRQVVKVNIPSGVKDLEASLPLLYPVPASGELNLRLPRPDAACSLFDAKGRVLSLSSRSDGLVRTWDVSALAPGLYFIRVEGRQSLLRFSK